MQREARKRFLMHRDLGSQKEPANCTPKSLLVLVISVDPASSIEKAVAATSWHIYPCHPARVTPARKPSEKGIWEGRLPGTWVYFETEIAFSL